MRRHLAPMERWIIQKAKAYLECRSRGVDPPRAARRCRTALPALHAADLGILTRSGLQAADREDRLQDVWKEVVARLDHLPYEPKGGRLSSWLITVARNRAVDSIRAAGTSGWDRMRPGSAPDRGPVPPAEIERRAIGPGSGASWSSSPSGSRSSVTASYTSAASRAAAYRGGRRVASDARSGSVPLPSHEAEVPGTVRAVRRCTSPRRRECEAGDRAGELILRAILARFVRLIASPFRPVRRSDEHVDRRARRRQQIRMTWTTIPKTK